MVERLRKGGSVGHVRDNSVGSNVVGCLDLKIQALYVSADAGWTRMWTVPSASG